MMTSCTPFNKIMYNKLISGPPSESQSEISSVDSDWSDIRAIALNLGVQNPDDLLTERFKIDRQKLENMIKTESSTEGFLNDAEFFFDNVMKETTTYISWPCRLKIGAKTKKDPHVRIVGKPEDVVKAKERILASLDSRGSRVIMKMDVSYTDHSYIIGRCGNNIKRIMEETSTHIHFPDSNRCNPTEKSNQVSLCGSLKGVERARALVRSSTPLLISFELPVIAPGKPVPDQNTPYVKEVETKYNVQVIFSTRPKLHSSLILVKGSEKEAVLVQEATQYLIDYTCDDIASQILVQMQLEISPQHHEVVKGKNSTNLLNIMERTKTKIIFPDVHDMNIKPIKKSQVTITGTIDGVYQARQQLIGNLPIALIFDYPDSTTDTTEIVNLSNKYGVFISLRQKQRQSTMAVVIKGVEKFIDKIYEARHEVLQLKTPIIQPEIPVTYFSPKDQDIEDGYRCTLTSLLSKYPESPLTPGFQINTKNNNNNNNNIPSNYLSPYNLSAYQQQQHQQQQNYQATPTSGNNCGPNAKYHHMHNNNCNSTNCHQNYHRLQQQQPCSSTNSINNNINNNNGSNNYLAVPSQMSLSPRNSSNNTSGYQSFSSSTTSLEQGYPPYPGRSASGGHYSPDSTFNSDGGGGGGGSSNNSGSCKNLRRLSDGSMQNITPTSTEFRTSSNYDLKQQQQQQQRAFDFDMKRVVGFKSMERQPQGEVRTPTASWIGLNLSRTSPAPLETVDDMGAWNHNSNNFGMSYSGQQISPYSLGATTGIVDSTPSNRRMQLSHHKDIHSLLTGLGLEHYIKTFVLNEIDLEIFTSLTEDNLIELGIKAFGARKKLLVAIHTLAAEYEMHSSTTSTRFSGSAAPGAERRTSSGW